MELLSLVVILIHPIAALMLISIFMKQRKWRQKRKFLKGQELNIAMTSHASDGNKIMISTIIVILLAFIGEIFRAILSNQPYDTYILPSNFHASGGLLGLLLMFILWRTGHSTHKRKQENKKFVKNRDSHGRIGDIMAILVIIHAFLGFLYLLQIL